MGRRKTKRTTIKKLSKPRLEKAFSCPFCNEDNSVECLLDRSKQMGTAKCRICQAGYQTVINYLSEPVDIFAEWVDAIDAQKQSQARSKSTKADNVEEENSD